MNPVVSSEVDCCRLCGFVFRDKRGRRNVVGEFAKMFEKVIGVEVLEGDKRAMCITRVGTELRNRGRVEIYPGTATKKEAPILTA